jgi:DNA helicase-2/ATP-dependent DNA helicase PcrA
VDAEEALSGLNDAQRCAVTHPASTLVIEAGAGTGKTRVLTRRIAYRAAIASLDPRHAVAITFTRKAASELTRRLRALGLRDQVTVGTFHALAYAQLRTRWADRGLEAPRLLDRKVGFVARLLGDHPDASPFEVANEIEWAKARLVGPSQYVNAARAEDRPAPLEPGVLAEVFARYETEKRRRRVVDYDDLLRMCCYDLNEDREFAAAQHWRHRHLFVDEFQDVNPLQFALLQAWLGARDDLCVVGDPNQAIYGWNGADAHYLADIDEYFPEAETVILDHNYRSSPQILAVAGAVLHGATNPAVLRPTRADGDTPSVVAYEDDRAEAAGIARAIRDAHRPGGRWGDQAVLVRTNAQGALIEEALRAAGIPFRVRGGRAITDEPVVKAALSQLQASSTPFLGAVDDLEAETPVDEAIEAANQNPADPAPSPGVPDAVDGPDRRRTLVDTLVRLAHDYAASDPTPTADGFEAWLRDGGAPPDERPGTDAVDLATFHAAKGLEWPVVHLAGLEQGFVPIAHATTPDALDEERRLLYVAITRAEHTLHLSWAKRRSFGSTTVDRAPSSYLAEAGAAIARLEGHPEPAVERAAFFAHQRVRLQAVDGSAGRPARDIRPDDDLSPAERSIYVALQEWRATTARAADVSPHVVLPDRTLAAVARAQPRTIDELRTIPGIGPVKANRYGDALLRVLLGHRAG